MLFGWYLFLVCCRSFSEVFQNTDWQNLPLISHVLEERKVELILSWILKKHVLLVKYNTAEKTSQQRLYVIVRLDFDLQFGNMESCEFKHILELNMLRAAKNELIIRT